MQWDGSEGKVTYFYDGYPSSTAQNELLKTQLSSGKIFTIGSSDKMVNLTQLNIWDYKISTSSIIAMSAGGFNVRGNLLSWNNLVKYLPINMINWDTEIYLPGKKRVDSKCEIVLEN